jgi:hypothetical protein
MTCITKLLEEKGNKEFIISPLCSGVAIEGGGKYKNYEWLVILNDMAFRCGYVAIPKSHPVWASTDYPYYEVHGGVTFFDKPHLVESECDDKWIGFDAGHLGFRDEVDIECAKKYFGQNHAGIKYIEENNSNKIFGGHNASIKTFSYMESECKKLIDQLENDNTEAKV